MSTWEIIRANYELVIACALLATIPIMEFVDIITSSPKKPTERSSVR